MPEMYTYRYPNAASYALLPINPAHGAFVGQGRQLRHGYIFGYKNMAAINTITGPSDVATAALRAAAAARQVDFQNSKVFQFNPPALGLSVQLMPVEDPALTPGQTIMDSGVGLASFSTQIIFDRTEEIARANAGHGDEKWRDLGVQVDLYELLKVISGVRPRTWASTRILVPTLMPG